MAVIVGFCGVLRLDLRFLELDPLFGGRRRGGEHVLDPELFVFVDVLPPHLGGADADGLHQQRLQAVVEQLVLPHALDLPDEFPVPGVGEGVLVVQELLVELRVELPVGLEHLDLLNGLGRCLAGVGRQLLVGYLDAEAVELLADDGLVHHRLPHLAHQRAVVPPVLGAALARGVAQRLLEEFQGDFPAVYDSDGVGP